MMTVETLLQDEWNEPTGIAARGTVVVVGGRGENPAVYQRFGKRISSDAYRVRFVEGDLSDLDGTAKRIDEVLADPQTELPVVLLGSDTGAAIVLDHVSGRVEGRARPDAVIVAGLTYPDRAASSGFADEISVRTACPNHRGVLGREGVDHALATGADVHIEPPAPGTVTVPVLAIHGAADEVVPVDEAQGLVAPLSEHVELVRVDEGLHDVLNDVTHRTVAATVVLFLERLKRGRGLAPIAVGA